MAARCDLRGTFDRVAPGMLEDELVLDFVELAEARRHAGFDGTLAQKARAEGMDRAGEEAFEPREGVNDAIGFRRVRRPLGAASGQAFLQRELEAAAELGGGLSRERDRGQVLDLEAEGRRLDEAALEDIHRRKTGQLIRAAIMMPSELAELSTAERDYLDKFARDIGLVFQIRDDLLEVEQDTATLGKNAGSDASNNKSTYPSTLGADGARRRAADLQRGAIDALDSLGDGTEGLRWLSEFILNRSH